MINVQMPPQVMISSDHGVHEEEDKLLLPRLGLVSVTSKDLKKLSSLDSHTINWLNRRKPIKGNRANLYR